MYDEEYISTAIKNASKILFSRADSIAKDVFANKGTRVYATLDLSKGSVPELQIETSYVIDGNDKGPNFL